MQKITFDTHGNLEQSADVLAEAAQDIARPGPADDAVAYWLTQLDFVGALEGREQMARDWLREFGAWDADELAEWDARELAERVLWLAACDYAEQGDWYGLVH